MLNIDKLFFSVNIKKMEEYYKDFIFTNTIKSLGAYNPKDRKIYINLDKIKDKETFIKVIYHESIHMLQDKRSRNKMSKILVNLKLNSNFSDIKEYFYFTNYFEIMAYASTYAIKCIIEGKDISKPNFSNIKEFNILCKNTKFLKYVYLYYNELKNSSIIKEIEKDINETDEFLDNMFQTYIV